MVLDANNNKPKHAYHPSICRMVNAHAHSAKQSSHTEAVASNNRLNHACQDRPTTVESALAQLAKLSSPSEVAAKHSPPHRAVTHSLR